MPDVAHIAKTNLMAQVLTNADMNPNTLLDVVSRLEQPEKDSDATGVIEWRNPDLYAFRSKNALAVKNYKGTELIVSGPTRCGKTLDILEMLFTAAFENPGMKILIVRAKEVDLRDSIKVDIRQTMLKYDLDDPLSPIKAVGARNFTHLLFPNGSEMAFAGMDRPGKVLGTSYDIVFYSQIEQSTPEEFETLKTRCSGDSMNWTDRDTGENRHLLIGDANPAQSTHYLIEREKDKDLPTEFIHFGFDDNPLFHRNGKRTAEGNLVINELDKSLTGIFHDRLFKGIWTSAHGVVFPEFDAKRHVKAIEKPVGGRWVMAVDFGFTNPSCALLINEHNGIMTVWRELYKTGLTLDDLIAEMKVMLDDEGVEIESLICDHDSEHIERLQREGFPAIHADKPIVVGLELIRSRLINDTLVISDRANRTPDTTIDKGVKCLVDEFGVYQYKPEDKRVGNDKDDIPVDKDNHGIDPLRYACRYFDEGNDVPEIGDSWSYN